MTNLLKSVVFVVLILSSTTGSAQRPSLQKDVFNHYWCVESESPQYQLHFLGKDTCEIVSPKGLTLWRKEKMTGDVTIEYDACVMDEGKSGDRLSDLNCFWMASDPKASTIFKRMKERKGNFLQTYSLRLYYMGYGGNYNTTTRFRRYDGDERGIHDSSFRPAILQEYKDAAHLLIPNHWYHIRIRNFGNRVQYYVDGEKLIDYTDPHPLHSGWFGFRTTLSRTRFANFHYEKSSAVDVPLHWIGEVPTVDQPICFGVPFAQGELKDVSHLSLTKGIPLDAWVNARWPDGSVKWAGIASVIPAHTDGLTLQMKKVQKGINAFQLMENPRQIVVSTGKIKAYIPKYGSKVIDSIYIGGTKIADAARLIASIQNHPDEIHGDLHFTSYVGKITKVSLEHSGSLFADVRIDGKMEGKERSWLPFTLRLYFFAGSEQVKVVHSFLFDGDQDKDFIHSLGLQFDIPMREAVYNRHIAFATDQGGVWSEPVQPLDGRRDIHCQKAQMEGKRISDYKTFDEQGKFLLDHWAQWDSYRLSQLSDQGFSIRKRATTDSPWIGTYCGNRAAGYAFVGDVSGGLGVQLRDFWQSYPSTLEVEHARGPMAQLTVWLWSPEAEPMDLRHYDQVTHNLLASYEDVQPGMSTPYGIGRTSTLYLYPQNAYPGKKGIAEAAHLLSQDARLMPIPSYLHEKRAFGIWSLPDTSNAKRALVEHRLDQYIDFYKKAIESNHWYGFWNYGDMMHAYDPERHSWRYDVGGFAWDNTELATPDWLWYSFLRTGRSDILCMAEAMTRHNSEVDTYHIGDMAGLGSRHNVSHWGCGAKEARISQAAFNRFMYYLTCDDRLGDVMHLVADADQMLYKIDPMRLAEPRSQYPCKAPARLRIGPDWLAYAGNWMTEWERTGNTKYRDKIIAGMKSIAALPHGVYTGNLAKGYDPATGVISYDGDTTLIKTNHLMTIMGGFEVMNELMMMVHVPAFNKTWLDFASTYKQMAWKYTHNRFPVRRLLGYAASMRHDNKLAEETWADMWAWVEREQRGTLRLHTIYPPEVPEPIEEWDGISTNDAALWSLDAIYLQEVIPQ